MLKDTVGRRDVIEYLNSLLDADAAAVSALFSLRISCGTELAEHPTVQVGTMGGAHPLVGFIGILNGLFGADEDGWGFLGAVYEEGRIVRFAEVDHRVKTASEHEASSQES